MLHLKIRHFVGVIYVFIVIYGVEFISREIIEINSLTSASDNLHLRYVNVLYNFLYTPPFLESDAGAPSRRWIFPPPSGLSIPNNSASCLSGVWLNRIGIVFVPFPDSCVPEHGMPHPLFLPCCCTMSFASSISFLNFGNLRLALIRAFSVSCHNSPLAFLFPMRVLQFFALGRDLFCLATQEYL